MREQYRRVFVWAFAVVTFLSTFVTPKTAAAERIRDLCDIVGVRENQLLGYAVVTGLNGTGDDVSQAPFAAQSLVALLRRLGIQIDPAQLKLKNVAAVLVTANLPAFAHAGQHLDVTLSAIGTARSLQGGVLLQAPLYGADMHVYAVAQGPIVLGGFEAKGSSGSSVRQNSTNTARIPEGALVEREITTTFIKDDVIMLALREADFTTAQRLVVALNKELGEGMASATDAGAIRVMSPDALKGKPVELLSRINDVEVSPAASARVVINERTGTIVAGGDVRLAAVAIAHGSLTVVIKETPVVSQPGPFATGTTTTVQRSDISHTEGTPGGSSMTYLEGAATLADVAKALSTLGASPRELTSLLQALRAAGALHAEIVVQ